MAYPTIHGHAKRDGHTKTYFAWMSMKKRCNDKKGRSYPRYGGRGITICKRWDSFVNFLEDMGEAPPGLSLDRKNNDRGYSKDNCQWASTEDQHRNTCRSRLIRFQGKTKCLRDWEIELGLGYGTLWRRFARGEAVPYAMRRIDK